jgi:CheY-like chemotaxis protein
MSKKKILVVDDEKDMVSVLLGRLKAYGYDVASAGGGEEALRMSKKEKFDLIIIDILMPGMDGTELARILRDDPKTMNIHVIFISALGLKRNDGGHTFAGSDIVFAKPYEIKKLMDKIDELLGG